MAEPEEETRSTRSPEDVAREFWLAAMAVGRHCRNEAPCGLCNHKTRHGLRTLIIINSHSDHNILIQAHRSEIQVGSNDQSPRIKCS